MSRPLAPAAWALVGKLPGDRGDFRLLAGHSPDDGEHTLTGQVWAAVPSVPQLSGLPGPGVLPWVTFVPRQEHGRHWLEVTVTEATGDRDAVGRPSVAVRHVRLSFADVAEESAGYEALYAAVPAMADLLRHRPAGPRSSPAATDTPQTPGLPALSLDADGGQALARALADGARFDRAARLAALLLDGDLMITADEEAFLPLSGRLAELDEVMALLPFGLRAGIAMATWYDGTTRGGGLPGDLRPHTYRLAYGPFPTHGEAVAPCAGKVPVPGGDIAYAYLAELRAAREILGPRKLAAHLAAHRAALGPDDAAQALEILRSLRDPGLVIEAIQEGHATIERVRNARQSGPDWYRPDELDVLDEYLLVHGDGTVMADVLSTWTERTAPLAARALLSRLRDAEEATMATVRSAWADPARSPGRRADDAESFMPLARRICQRAVESGDGEAFFHTLAKGRDTAGDKVPLPAVAPLLMALMTTKPRGDLPAVRAEIWRNPRLARLILRRLLDGVPVNRAWLDWLAPGPGEAAPGWPPGYLILVQPGSALQQTVRLDTLRLYVRLPARDLPLTGSATACRHYLDALWDQWSQSPLDADRAELAASLVHGVNAMLEGLSVPGVVDGVITVLRAVVADERVPLSGEVAEEIVGLLTGVPGLMTDARLDEGWWGRVERVRPDVRAPDTRLRAAVRDPHASPVDIAVRMGEAADGGLPPEELLAITARWLGQAAEVPAMLQIIEGVLRIRQATGAAPMDVGGYMALLRELLGVPGQPGLPAARPEPASPPGTLRRWLRS